MGQRGAWLAWSVPSASKESYVMITSSYVACPKMLIGVEYRNECYLSLGYDAIVCWALV